MGPAICEFQATCEACTSLTFCMFMILAGDFNTTYLKCTNKKDFGKYSSKTVHVYVYEWECSGIDIDFHVESNLSHHYPFEEHIQKSILTNYSSYNSPSSVTNKPTILKLRLEIRNFYFNNVIMVLVVMLVCHYTLGPDDSEPSVLVNSSLFMRWNDSRLSWYKNHHVFLDQSKAMLPAMMFLEFTIWTPELTPQFGAYISRTNNNSSNEVFVEKTGRVSLDYPLIIQSSCFKNLRQWPFEFYSCHFGIDLRSQDQDQDQDQKFAEFKIEGSDFDLTNQHSNQNVKLMPLPLKASYQKTFDNYFISVENMVQNPSWKLLKPKATRYWSECTNCTEPYVVFSFNLETKFPSSLYDTVVIVTAFGIVLLTFLVLLLKPSSLRKILLAFINLFTVLYTIIYFGIDLMDFGPNVPWLSLIAMLSLIFSVITRISARTRRSIPFPKSLKLLISNNKLLVLLRLDRASPQQVATFTISYYSKAKREQIRRYRLQNQNQCPDQSQNQQHSGQSQYPGQSQGEENSGVPVIDDTRDGNEFVVPAINSNLQWLLLISVIERTTFVFYLFVSLLFLLLVYLP